MKAIFCGNEALLLQSAQVFLDRGGEISGVLSRDPRVVSWAVERDLPVFASDQEAVQSAAQCDFLFSIANTQILSADLIDLPRLAAINLHDGPLPARIGVNVPVWSIYEGRTAHAITWHAMQPGLAPTRAYLIREFDIAPEDTAFSLNARCYETALETFPQLLTLLEKTPEPAIILAGTGQRYNHTKRPAHDGQLDLQLSASDLMRQIRALDHGSYKNPVALPKLWTGQQVLMIRSAKLSGAASGVPGQVIEVTGDTITVSCQDSDLVLHGLQDANGNAPKGLEQGHILPPPLNVDIGLSEGSAKQEGNWAAALLSAKPAIPPYPRNTMRNDAVQQRILVDIPAKADATQLTAAWLAWNAGLNGAQNASISVLSTPGSALFAGDRPMGLDIDPEQQVEQFLAQARAEWERVTQASPMAVDLPLRMGAQRDQALNALSVAVDLRTSPATTTQDFVLIPAEGDLPAKLSVSPALMTDAVVQAIARDFAAFLQSMLDRPEAALGDLPLGTPTIAARSDEASDGAASVHAAFRRQVAATPDATALEVEDRRFTYRQLDADSDALARVLQARGAQPGQIVGLCLERSADLVVAMLAILKTGAAYLPLDPSYPEDRITYMIEDSAAALIVSSPSAAARLSLPPQITIMASERDQSGAPLPDLGAENDLMNLIYTSGSTGRPKGVMIPHRTVLNFMAGMDDEVPLLAGSRLFGVTSVSFDISVLEIFWILSRGATLVLQTDGASETVLPDFSLFYFASEASGTGHHAYRLLIEGAKFADQNGFKAVWTPERHFHAFGGLYPNPAIAAATLAGITNNIELRAGSAVLPLHHPVQVAEDWALVDNLSNGRAGIALASGWQPNDFVLNPSAFARRKEVMIEGIDTLRALWKGEERSFPGHDDKPVSLEIHPRPVRGDIPLWLTAAGNPETFAAAAQAGCGVLTHLLGQSFDEVAEKIRAYRLAWRAAGHPGNGHVVLMLHTFVSDDEEKVRTQAREPMKQYLRSSVDLLKKAAWTSPLMAERSRESGMNPQEMFEKQELSEDELDALLDHAFERYYHSSGLFGTPDSAGDMVRQLAQVGVDEIACLIDFGIDTDVVMENLPHIKALMDNLTQQGGVDRKATVAEEIIAKEITHLQCTPPMASLLAADGVGRQALGQLDVMMVGGEAFPPDLARGIRDAMAKDGLLLNMYGPTEATIWSSVARLDDPQALIPLGDPIRNTTLSIRSDTGRELPDLVEGELWIGGEGVADGYWKRRDLTAERFVSAAGQKFYRTGDLVRRGASGQLEFLGRKDNQVKIRGYRMELGEIEGALGAVAGVRQAVVKAVEFGPGDIRLVGYVTASGPAPDPAALGTALAQELPDFMVPSQFMVMADFPLTPNGKIDRKALPKPVLEQVEDGASAATEFEAGIAEIWAEALDVPSVPVTVNFFDLGGHSLLVVQLRRRLKDKLGLDVAVTDIFRFPTVRGLAEHLGQSGTDTGNQPSKAASRGAARARARLAHTKRR
ncbi:MULTISPECIES: MupA/Atu3671 family FMN-dependent luciferase-like monooxygenase [unclassified Ruegeria]|uniref:MupA/Atu3671 family FMN-dependent luciferase-like monooxygenase n=1 Tax=unclassified Ruegeria TaxID=2625375 RepID=UPI0014885EF4